MIQYAYLKTVILASFGISLLLGYAFANFQQEKTLKEQKRKIKAGSVLIYPNLIGKWLVDIDATIEFMKDEKYPEADIKIMRSHEGIKAIEFKKDNSAIWFGMDPDGSGTTQGKISVRSCKQIENRIQITLKFYFEKNADEDDFDGEMKVVEIGKNKLAFIEFANGKSALPIVMIRKEKSCASSKKSTKKK